MNKDKIYLAIISILLIISLVFGLMWFLGSDSGSKERIHQLENNIAALEKKKQISEKNIAYWIKRFSNLQKRQDSINLVIGRLKKELASTRKKIEDFKKNPPNRTGNSLLESIKNKTSKK